MAVPGSGPQPTSPWYITDEHVSMAAPGDFGLLSPRAQSLASSCDGYFSADAPWVLNSTIVNFQSQGVAAQNVVALHEPHSNFPGGHWLYAVDSVSSNSCTLRMVGAPLNFGQPPAPVAGLTAVKFTTPSIYNTLDRASYEIKRYLRIDEAIYWRNSAWSYQGAEDLYRVFREIAVQQALVYLFTDAVRGGDQTADWMFKLGEAKRNLEYMKAQVEVRWGPFGNSSEPTNALGTRITR